MGKFKSNYKPSIKDDCQTPGYALAPIISVLLSRNPSIKKIWEPAVGEGYMQNMLELIGMEVMGTDIKTGHDFLTFNMGMKYDCIITNPPYSVTLKYPFIERCYELKKPFALLMSVETLGAKKAQQLFSKYGMGMIVMDRRINFKMPNMGWEGSGSDYPVAWFTNGLGIDKIEYYSYNWLTKEKIKEFEV